MHKLEDGTRRSLERRYQQAPDSWANRIEVLAKTLDAVRVLGPQDDQINQIVWERYLTALQQDPVAYQKFLDQFASWDLGKQLEYFAGVRNAYAQDADDIRDKLRKKGMAPSGKRAVEVVAEKLRRQNTEWTESSHHPLNHLYPTIGYEIEHDLPMDRHEGIYYFLHQIGFRKGTGGSGAEGEASPGPFYRPETAALVYLLWTQAGLFDFYREYRQTMHSNLGVHLHDGMPDLVLGLMATGFAWQPEFRDAAAIKRATWGLRIYSNMGESAVNHYDNYQESKDFDNLTVSETVSHLHLWSHLGAALKAYQKALLEVSGYLDHEDYFKTHSIEPQYGRTLPVLGDSTFDPRLIVELGSLTVDEKKLARVWYDYSLQLHRGLTAVGLSRILDKSEGNGALARRFGELVTEVFPDIWSHYHVAPDKTLVRPFVIRGTKYSNFVHFARSIAWSANNQVRQIMRAAERDFQSGLFFWAQDLHQGLDSRFLTHMSQRFPCQSQNLFDYQNLLTNALTHYQ